MADQIRSSNNLRKGLGMICFSVFISFVMTLVWIIVALVTKTTPRPLAIANSVVSIVSVVFVIIGSIICLFSGQRYFTQALILYILFIIGLIVSAILSANSKSANWLNIVLTVLLALAHLSILKGLRESTQSKSKFNAFILTVCILLFLAVLVIAILGSIPAITLNTGVIHAAYIMISIEYVLFFIAILTSYAALK